MNIGDMAVHLIKQKIKNHPKYGAYANRPRHIYGLDALIKILESLTMYEKLKLTRSYSHLIFGPDGKLKEISRRPEDEEVNDHQKLFDYSVAIFCKSLIKHGKIQAGYIVEAAKTCS